MARAGSWISSRCSINAISQAQPIKPFFYFSPNNTKASLKGNDFSLITKRSQRACKRLVTISTSDGRWHGEWKCDYIFSLRDLQLEDLAEDGHKDTQVSINLCIHKHTGFGLSVDGRVITSFTRKCSNCSSTYCREIDASFKVWVLPSSRQKGSATDELPLLGWDDPSVIYVKPGFEADLDSLIQDTISLAAAVKETCSESCEKSQPKLQPLGKENAASIDRRWSRLLELKKVTLMKSQ
ncbi:large ribosomal RNA subunit accumulation protein YCED homolog 2, chloroplastic isoform X1 [Nicotiana tomentosiformis]|uniref:large ribosomal RNA subunit accumulation protein YCED homolog 2, chloroplastic isoform X1 n=1 Tax=Nicotiana tomentosiformis TaxID=4098 RepID=UPI00051ADC30|nr:large ribosomal RNA subunit accumulation protein YCED homolog 2, chloroplastic isoform X1 [Nicotiana tomentosiformis]